MSPPAGSGSGPEGAATGAILSGPEDSIFDDIFDWIANAIGTITRSVTDWVTRAWQSIIDHVATWITWAVDTIRSSWGNITGWVRDAVDWARSTYSLVSSWISGAWSTITGAVGSAISRVWDWITSAASSAISWIGARLSDLWSWISGALSNVWSSISGFFSQLWGNITSFFSGIWSGIVSALSSAVGAIQATLGTIIDQVNAAFDWFTGWINDNVVKPLGTWWDKFVDRILDFPAWIGKFFDAIEAWITVDVPGHSPRWTAIFENIGHWFATWFYEFPKWFFGDLPENVAYGLAASWSWFSDKLEPMVGSFMDALIKYTSQIGPIDPKTATRQYSSLITVGASAVFGLVGMTLAGELLHPLKNLGLGNIAAMIFDLTNYKMLTGAFVTALATAAIGLPLRWYYYSLFRPAIPSIRDGMDFYASDDITLPTFKDLLAYHGIPDVWHDAYADSAFKAPTPIQLATAAEAGAIDETTMLRELRRAGYHPDIRKLFIDSFKKSAAGQLKAVMVGEATGRFKKGYTDQSGLEAELRILRVGDSLIPAYVMGAILGYKTQYLDDLIDAYTYAVRAGNMALEDYKNTLLGLGVKAERVSAYVLRERARVKPKETLTMIGTPEKIYLTDAGKLQLETIRIRRVKNTITRAQEINQLGALGIDTAYAETIANNDDAKLLEKIDLEPAKTLPLYQTPAGKIKLDTIRDSRRKGSIDRVAELTALAALGVPEYLAEAYSGNDDVAIAEKIPTETAAAAPAYETDAGKLQIDTIRRSRRKSTITREDEIGQLAALDMPDWLVQATVENDDIRMAEKGGGE